MPSRQRRRLPRPERPFSCRASLHPAILPRPLGDDFEPIIRQYVERHRLGRPAAGQTLNSSSIDGRLPVRSWATPELCRMASSALVIEYKFHVGRPPLVRMVARFDLLLWGLGGGGGGGEVFFFFFFGVSYARSKHIGDIGDAGNLQMSGVSTDRPFHIARSCKFRRFRRATSLVLGRPILVYGSQIASPTAVAQSSKRHARLRKASAPTTIASIGMREWAQIGHTL